MNLLKLGGLITDLIDRYEKEGTPMAIEVTPMGRPEGTVRFEFLLSINIADVITVVEQYSTVPYTKSDKLRGEGPGNVVKYIDDLIKSY